MKPQFATILICLLMLLSCKPAQQEAGIAHDRLYAWCIVPFDSERRSPQERIDMLKRLGLEKYAYDWRVEHLNTTAEEIALARKQNIEINALWLWIDDRWDSVGQLNQSNERLFAIIEEAQYEGQIWVSFHANYFEDLADEAAVAKGVQMIGYLSRRAKALGCQLALYNHGDWFGEPANQVKIIEALPNEELGIIYNFHHAHEQLDSFPEITTTMLPYLWGVNLNGLRKGGPKILTIGKGNYEKEFINILLEAGYKGDFGILGHVESANVEIVLDDNLEGLRSLFTP